MTQERRKQARFNKTLDVFLCPTKYLLETNTLSRDISEDGICLVSPYKIEIGEIVKLGIQLPNTKVTSEVTGEIVRRNETDDPKFPYLLGICFIEISPEAKEQIQEHMRFYMVSDQ